MIEKFSDTESKCNTTNENIEDVNYLVANDKKKKENNK